MKFSLPSLINSAEISMTNKGHKPGSWSIFGQIGGQKAICYCTKCSDFVECLTNPEKGEVPINSINQCVHR